MGTLKPLTARQQAVLDVICKFSQEKGFSPSLREIGQGVGLTNISAVRGHVAALEKKGYLQREPDQPRSMRVMSGASWMSRIRRKLHEFARTDEGVLHSVQYALVLATRQPEVPLSDELAPCIGAALGRLSTEHGWTFIQTRIGADHLAVVVRVWPNHSPELVANRLRAATEHAIRRARRDTGRVWAKGYGVATHPEQMDDIVQQFLGLAAERAGGSDVCVSS